MVELSANQPGSTRTSAPARTSSRQMYAGTTTALIVFLMVYVVMNRTPFSGRHEAR
jgi:hypothetical protein